VDADPRAGGLEPARVRLRLVLAHEQQHQRERIGALLVQRDPQPGAGARHPLARRLLGDAQHAAQLPQRQPGLEAQREHRAIVHRQAGERLARGTAVRGLARRLVQPRRRSSRAAAQLVEREVRRGAPQPGRQHRRGRVARRARPRAQERLLADVLGRLGVAGHPAQPPAQRGPLGPERRLEAHANHSASAAAAASGALSIGMCPDPGSRRSVAPGISAA
jgi:hypothetical protein